MDFDYDSHIDSILHYFEASDLCERLYFELIGSTRLAEWNSPTRQMASDLLTSLHVLLPYCKGKKGGASLDIEALCRRGYERTDGARPGAPSWAQWFDAHFGG